MIAHPSLLASENKDSFFTIFFKIVQPAPSDPSGRLHETAAKQQKLSGLRWKLFCEEIIIEDEFLLFYDGNKSKISE